MRNVERIDPFLQKLGSYWKKVPDWRFGQLMSNVCAWLGDPFFYEDDEFLNKFEEYFSESKKNISKRR